MAFITGRHRWYRRWLDHLFLPPFGMKCRSNGSQQWWPLSQKSGLCHGWSRLVVPWWKEESSNLSIHNFTCWTWDTFSRARYQFSATVHNVHVRKVDFCTTTTVKLSLKVGKSYKNKPQLTPYPSVSHSWQVKLNAWNFLMNFHLVDDWIPPTYYMLQVWCNDFHTCFSSSSQEK